MVCNRNLRTEQMTSVDLARDYAKRMVDREAAGTGDVKEAMHRIEAMTGFSFSTLWNLRYRPPKTIDRDVFRHLYKAYLKVCDHHLAALVHEIKTDVTRGADDADDDLVVEAEAMAQKLKAARARVSARRSGGYGR